MKFEFSFGVIPILNEGAGYAVLLLEHGGKHWAFPKGHPEKGERGVDTARREFEEETGIHAHDLDENIRFTEEYFFKRDGELIKKQVIYFPALVHEKEFTLQKEEISRGKWVSLGSATQEITFKGGKELVAQLKDYLARYKA